MEIHTEWLCIHSLIHIGVKIMAFARIKILDCCQNMKNKTGVWFEKKRFISNKERTPGRTLWSKSWANGRLFESEDKKDPASCVWLFHGNFWLKVVSLRKRCGATGTVHVPGLCSWIQNHLWSQAVLRSERPKLTPNGAETVALLDATLSELKTVESMWHRKRKSGCG